MELGEKRRLSSQFPDRAPHGNCGTASILRRPLAKFVSFGGCELVRRHLHGDALSDSADLPHGYPESQWRRDRLDRGCRGGDPEYRAGLFRFLVGQAAKKKAHRLGGLPAGGTRQAVDGRCHGMAGLGGRAVAGPVRHRCPFGATRCAHRLFGRRGEQGGKPSDSRESATMRAPSWGHCSLSFS